MKAFTPTQTLEQIKAADERLDELLKLPEVKEALDLVDRIRYLEHKGFEHEFEINGGEISIKK